MDKIVNSKYLKRGNHLILLYETASEMTSVISKYIIESLKNNEKCFYIDSESDKNSLISELSEKIQLEKYLKSGQLLFLDKSEAYSESGEFIPDKMIDLLQKKCCPGHYGRL